ncbi:MAG: glycosyltransferase [bacterium]
MIGIVIPWFGRDLKGGAEQLAREIARRLAARGHDVHVLTTCSRAFLDDWGRNALRSGASEEDGVRVRRFAVDRRDARAFDRLNGRLLAIPPEQLRPGISPLAPDEEAAFWRGNINSSALLRHLESETRYRAIVFLPYLYGPIVRGIPLVASRAYLQPCLHDEPYAYLPAVANAVYRAKRLLLNSDGELETLQKIFGAHVASKAVVVGTGVEIDDAPAAGLRQVGTVSLSTRFLLCLGRRDAGKGVDGLTQAFRGYRQRHGGSELRLVLAGPGASSWGDEEHGIHDLGLVGDVERNALLAHCVALAQPSLKESYSRVLMEAWRFGKPVLVQERCAATARAVRSSGGGWTLDGDEAWIAAFASLAASTSAELATIGAKGREYARARSDWDEVIGRYEALLREDASPPTDRPRSGRARERIDQVLPNLVRGDAISDYALYLKDRCRELGFDAEIYARHLDRSAAEEGRSLGRHAPPPGAPLLYHHSIGGEVTDWVRSRAGLRGLIYHNITPGRFLRPFNPRLADLADRGRSELPALAPLFAASAGDSQYNVAELRDAGFASPSVLPIPVEPTRFFEPPDEAVLKSLDHGGANLLFVGRISPQKRQEDLLFAFAEYVKLDPSARLHLVGFYEAGDSYFHYLRSLIWKLGLTGRVDLTGSVSNAKLHAYYRAADLFWCMSEHEGLCIPLVEAMWFEVPIVAFKAAAVPETLADAGILLTDKDDPARSAALARIVVEDETIRRHLVEAQRENRRRFQRAEHERAFATFLDRFLAAAPAHA